MYIILHIFKVLLYKHTIMEGIDEKDLVILETLKENSELSMQKIAKKTGIPMATVHHRVKRLKKDGIIEKYTIRINKEKLGKKVIAHILVKIGPKIDIINMLRTLTKNELVEAGSALAGEFDILLKVRVVDIDELDGFVLKYLRTFQEITETRTMIAFENIVKY